MRPAARALLGLIPALVLTLTACDLWQDEKTIPLEMQDATPPLSLEQRRASLRDRLRVGPDRRFLLAATAVQRLLSGITAAAVVEPLPGGRLRVSCGSNVVGELAAQAGMDEALALLTGLARRQAAVHPLAAAGAAAARAPSRAQPLTAAQFFAPDAGLGLLWDLDQRWQRGRRDAALVHEAARAFAVYAFHLADPLEIGDAVAAQALALLALERALTGGEDAATAVLVAAALGYGDAVTRAAERLGDSDSLRLFARRDEAALERSGDVVAAHLLQRLRPGYHAPLPPPGPDDPPVPQRRLLALHADFVRAHDSGDMRAIPVLPWQTLALLTGLLVDEAASPRAQRLEASRGARAALREESDAEKGALRALALLGDQKRGIVPNLEGAIATVGNHLPPGPPLGPLLDAELARTWYRAQGYGVIHDLGRFYLHELGSRGAAATFAARLGRPTEPLAAAVVGWFNNWRNAAAAGPNERTSFNPLFQSGLLPLAGPLMIIFKDLSASSAFFEPAREVQATALFQRLDSRPLHLTDLIDLAWSNLHDLRQALALYQSLMRVEGDDDRGDRRDLGMRIWYGELTGDRAALLRLAEDARVAPWSRLGALLSLRRLQALADAELSRRARALLAESPQDWALMNRYLTDLEERKAYAEGEAVVSAYLKASRGEDSLGRVIATVALARQLHRQGRLDEAWRVVRPTLASGQSGALQRAALILADLGRGEEALPLALARRERYPGPESTAGLVELLWRLGRTDEAAQQVAAVGIGGESWYQELGKAFADIFALRPLPEVLTAHAALQQKGAPVAVSTRIAHHLASRGQLLMAHEVLAHTPVANISQLTMRGQGFAYLAKVRGEDAAIEWVKEAVPPGMREPLTLFLYADARADRPLWEVVPLETNDYTWLLRAAAWRRGGKPPQREAALRSHYAAGNPSPYHVLGRYLMGLVPLEAVIGPPLDSKRTCEAAYFLGVAAEAERRPVDALDWYRVALGTGSVHDGEYMWSQEALRRLLTDASLLAGLGAQTREAVAAEPAVRPAPAGKHGKSHHKVKKAHSKGKHKHRTASGRMVPQT